MFQRNHEREPPLRIRTTGGGGEAIQQGRYRPLNVEMVILDRVMQGQIPEPISSARQEGSFFVCCFIDDVLWTFESQGRVQRRTSVGGSVIKGAIESSPQYVA